MNASFRLTRAPVVLAVTPWFDPSGRSAVPGIVLGPLAVTPNAGPTGGWCITVIKSGLWINAFDDGVFLVRAHAVAAMRDLLALSHRWDLRKWSARGRRRRRVLVSQILRRHGGTTDCPEWMFP